MLVCPVCETTANEGQEYCLNCAWEFEYYFDELSEEERERYEDRLRIQKKVYSTNKKISIVKPKTTLYLWISILFVFLLIFLGFYLFKQNLNMKYKEIDLKQTNKLLEDNILKQERIISYLDKSGNILKGKKLFYKCKGCHGENGELKALGKSGIIAGKSKKYLIEAIKGYKKGELNLYGLGMVMKGQVSSLKEEDIYDVSEYISSFIK